MTEQAVLDIALKTIWVTVQIAAPSLVAAVLIGLLVSIFQAATQINEQTLSFIPKILAMFAVMVVTGPWVMHTMMQFTIEIIETISLVKR
jgi:flagellar biosynthesis protein FliQ